MTIEQAVEAIWKHLKSGMSVEAAVRRVVEASSFTAEELCGNAATMLFRVLGQVEDISGQLADEGNAVKAYLRMQLLLHDHKGS